MANIDTLEPGQKLPELIRSCDIVQSFLYNAALWNAHRIHFEAEYATDVEGYPGLVVPGPLLGDWLTQCAEAWAGDEAQLVSFEYSNRLASYVGDEVAVGGEVTAVDRDGGLVQVDLAVRNTDGDVITPGKATFRFSAPGAAS